jgi:bifunctional non-homologous end joining protein LigD
VSHPNRVIDAESGATKFDLLRYYADISAWILPQLRGRPCSLLRAPAGLAGKMFFQKHADRVTVPFVTVLDAELWPDHQPLLEVATRLALLSAAQMNVIEFHTWNARTKQIDYPDRIVFDLDPGEGVPWKKVREAAIVTRALLTELRLKAWLKTSGGKGLHVVVPISTEHEPATVAQFSKAFVTHMARVIPDRFVARSGAANRVGRIFVDYLRNSKGATTVAAYSTRARPGLGVSMPVDWDDLDGVKSGNQWTIRTAPDHVARRPADPWRRYAHTKQSLTPAIQRLAAAKPRT